MSQSTFSLTYDGGFRDGFDAISVRERVINVLGLNPKQVERVFSGKSVVLKHGLSEDDAVRFCARLNAIGMAVGIRLDAAVPSEPRPMPPKVVEGEGGNSTILPVASRAEDAARVVRFEFHGDGAEYFRIWIVNILLSIVTLGIYSAWAKVRTQRYFYGNTRLDGAAFDYLGEPVKILKGRVVAFVLLIAYMLSDTFSPLLGGIAFVIFMAVMPWIVVAALRFRNHNSAWRGIRMRFEGSLLDAYKAFLLWPALGVLTLGILMPYAFFRQLKFAIDGSRFGTSAFDFSGRPTRVYLAFGAFVGVMAVTGVVAGLIGVAVPLLIPLVLGIGAVLAFALYRLMMTNFRFNHTRLAGHLFESDYDFASYGKLVLVNTLGMIFTLGLFYPWAKVRTARYAAEHVRVVAHDDLERFIAERQQDVSATGSEVGEFFDVDLGF